MIYAMLGISLKLKVRRQITPVETHKQYTQHSYQTSNKLVIAFAPVGKNGFFNPRFIRTHVPANIYMAGLGTLGLYF